MRRASTAATIVCSVICPGVNPFLVPRTPRPAPTASREVDCLAPSAPDSGCAWRSRVGGRNITKKGNLRVLIVELGKMGMAHARAYDKIDGFELAGLCESSIANRANLPAK